MTNIIKLSDLTIISVTGDDAFNFLQGQLSHDITLANSNRAVLAAYCSPKGRVLATMIVVSNSDNSYLLITKADNAMAFAQRLRMFVLRSKVNIQILNTNIYGTYKIADSQDDFYVESINNESYISLPSADNTINRFLILSEDILDINNEEYTLARWQADDIKAGLPWVIAANQDMYIPQTLNFDLINGLSFTKGCYPGQEVVARSHYRGTIKRRCVYAKSTINNQNLDTNNLVGNDIFNANNPINPCGRIINAVLYKDELFLLLEIQLSDLDNADFRLKNSDGLKIEIQKLPYELQKPA